MYTELLRFRRDDIFLYQLELSILSETRFPESYYLRMPSGWRKCISEAAVARATRTDDAHNSVTNFIRDSVLDAVKSEERHATERRGEC